MARRTLSKEEGLQAIKRARELLEKGETQYFENIITEEDYRFDEEETTSSTASPVTPSPADKPNNTLFQINLDSIIYILIGIICFLIIFLSIGISMRRKKEKLEQALTNTAPEINENSKEE